MVFCIVFLECISILAKLAIFRFFILVVFFSSLGSSLNLKDSLIWPQFPRKESIFGKICHFHFQNCVIFVFLVNKVRIFMIDQKFPGGCEFFLIAS